MTKVDYNVWKKEMFRQGYDKLSKVFEGIDVRSILNVGIGLHGGEDSIRWIDFYKELFPNISRISNLELFEDRVKKKLNHPYYKEVIHGDVRQVDEYFAEDEFDLVMWMSGPEHVPREDWPEAFRRVERVAKKLVVYHVPWGSGYNDDVEHLTHSIRRGEMESYGYKTVYAGVEDTKVCCIRTYKIL